MKTKITIILIFVLIVLSCTGCQKVNSENSQSPELLLEETGEVSPEPSLPIVEPEESEPQYVELTSKDFVFDEINGEITFVKYTGTSKFIIIPNTIDDKPISCIAEGAFKRNDEIEGVIIPGSVSVIGDSAFQDCHFLKKVEVEGAINIGNNAFAGCYRLEDVSLPDTLVTIGEECFCMCESLKKIHLPSSLTALPRGCFALSGLESISVPGNVIEIGSDCFNGCENLSKIVLYEGVTVIGAYAFGYCENLRMLQIPSSLRSTDLDCLCGSPNTVLIMPNKLPN